jgi:transposase-like protein
MADNGHHPATPQVTAMDDQFGTHKVIDVLVSTKRDLAATRRFFTQALQHGPPPTEVTPDRSDHRPK